MNTQRALKQSFFAFLAIGGIGCAFAFMFANTFVYSMLEDMALAVALGAPDSVFQDYAHGVLAGGRIVLIHYELATGFALLSLLIGYIGIQGILLDLKGMPVTTLFRKKYWQGFSWSFFQHQLSDSKQHKAAQNKRTQKAKNAS